MAGLKYFLKSLLKPLIYRFPPIMIQPERLMLWQQTLIETAEVDGDIVEVGCYLGGTAAVAARMMKTLGNKKHYRVYDTFSGFITEQWTADFTLGCARRFFLKLSRTNEVGLGQAWWQGCLYTSRRYRHTSRDRPTN